MGTLVERLKKEFITNGWEKNKPLLNRMSIVRSIIFADRVVKL